MGTIAQKLEYLNDTRLLLKDNINKINNVLTDNSTFRSYPQELFNGYLDVLNNGTDTLWSNLEKVSQTGTEAVLESVETAPIKMVLNGNTSQDGTPTPDTPVDIQVVTGENVVSVSGKNLLDMSYLVKENADKTYGAYGMWAFNVSDVAGTYTLSRENSNVIANSSYIAIGQGTDVNEAYTNKVWLAHPLSANLNKQSITITNENKLWLFFHSNIERINNIINDFGYLMLELGSTATDFVPYSKTDYPISLGTIEMCKIGDYKDYLFKRNGKWYVHKEIEKVILDGTEKAQSYKYGDNYRFTITPNEYINNIYYSGETLNSMNNRIETSRKYTIENPSLAITPALFCHTTGVLITMTPKYNLSTIDDIKNWLSNNNVTLYYVLATPTEEEITNTTLISQLEAINNAKSVKDKTYITQTNDELPFILDVEAIKEYEVN